MVENYNTPLAANNPKITLLGTEPSVKNSALTKKTVKCSVIRKQGTQHAVEW